MAELKTSQKMVPGILTAFGLLIVAASAWAVMEFATCRLGVPSGYWLVAVFGALGGVVGGVLRAENKLELCSFESFSRVNLGILGDIVMGLGGAAALVFVFGSTLLKFNPNEADSLMLIVSVSFVGGAYGRKIVEIAGDKLLARAREEARQVAKEEAQTLVGRPAAMAYTHAAKELNNSGEPQKALDTIKTALQNDPTFVGAYVEQGRALKRLGRLEEALASLEKGLKIDPDKPEALYNRACYNSLLGRKATIAADLKKVFTFRPKLRESTATDHDLDNVRNEPEIKEILENPGPAQQHPID